MTVYDLQNVTVETIGTVGYRIRAVDGYCIHLPTHEENEYALIIAVPVSYDFSTVQVLPIVDLPEGSEIHGNVNEEVTE